MSAITADGVSDVPRREVKVKTEPGRIRRFLKKARQKIASGASRVWDATKATGRFCGRVVARGTGIIGATTFWVVKTLAAVLAAAVALVLVVPALVVGVIALAIYLLGQIYDLVNRYLYRPTLWLARGRPTKYSEFKLAWKIKAKEKEEKGETVWTSVVDRIKAAGLSEDFLAEHGAAETATVSEDGRLIVTPKGKVEIYRAPLTDIETIDDVQLKANLGGFFRVAKEFVDQAQLHPDLYLPGVGNPSIPVEVDFDPESKLENPDDPFSNEGALFEPHFQPIVSYFQSGQLAVDHDFSPYLDDPETLLMSFEFLRESAGVIEERSYWMGRYEMLRRWMEMPTKAKKKALLEEHGRVWALVHTELFNHQDRYSLKHVGAGVKAQAAELINFSKTPATR